MDRHQPWPLTGREEVLRRVEAALRRRDGAGVLLLGPEGAGKTRLAAEAADRLAARGTTVTRTAGTSAAAGLPFAALADLLPRDLDAASSPLELLRLTARRVRATASPRGVVLAVDDAHLLDDSSAALVTHLLSSGVAKGLLVVRGEAVPDALVPLVAEGSCEQVRVPPLGPDDLSALCRAVLGGPLDGATQHRLQVLSGGNLLYLRELLDAWVQEGRLRAEDGIWRADGTPDPGARLAEVVARRFARLDPDVRTVVETIALVGAVEVSLLERLVGLPAVLTAERAQLLRLEDDGPGGGAGPGSRRSRAALPHPLYAQVLRGSTPALAAREHRRRLAVELRATGCRRRGDLLRVAALELDAGRTPQDDVLLAASRSAAELFDAELAVRLTAAAAAGGTFAARLAWGEALNGAGRTEEAETLLAALHTETVDDPGARGRVVVVRAANLVGGFGRWQQAEELVRDARRELAENSCDPGLDAELAALAGTTALSSGRPREALELVEPLLVDTPPEGRPGSARSHVRAHVRALLVAMSAWGQVGRGNAAVEVGRRLLADAGPDRDLPAVHETALVGLCYAYGTTGRLAQAEELARTRYAAALEQRAPDLRTLWALALGQAGLLRGDVEHAQDHLREAAALLRHDRSVLGVHSLAWCLGCLAEAAALQGDPVNAQAVLDEADRVTPEPCFIAPREAARVWVAWAQGSVGRAQEVAFAVAEQARARGATAVEAHVLHQAARLGGQDAVRDRLADLAELVDGGLTAAHAAHARARSAQDHEDVALAYEGMGCWLDAAESSARASAEFGATGHSAAATRAARRAADLAGRCPGARSPGLLLSPVTQELTAREREIVDLAGRGMTSAQIAQALVVSGRTVENHLHRAYTKLGVTSRRELRDVLQR